MKKFDKVIWAVKTVIYGGNPTDFLFKSYADATIFYEIHDCCDKPRKQFITNEQYYELEKLGAFED